MLPENVKKVQKALDRARALPSHTEVEEELLAALEIAIFHLADVKEDLKDVTAANDAKSQALVRLQDQEKALRARVAPPWTRVAPTAPGYYWATLDHPRMGLSRRIVFLECPAESNQLRIWAGGRFCGIGGYRYWSGPLVPPEEVDDAPTP